MPSTGPYGRNDLSRRPAASEIEPNWTDPDSMSNDPRLPTRVLVVAGAAGDVEAFSVSVAGLRLHKVRARADALRQLSRYWKEREPFSLGRIAHLIPAARRRHMRPFPRSSQPLLMSRLRAHTGDLRIEYTFRSDVTLPVLKSVCREVVRNRPGLRFVVGVLGLPGLSVRAALITDQTTEVVTVPRARGQVHLRRERRKWRDVDPTFARSSACYDVLGEASSHWDTQLASKMRTTNPRTEWLMSVNPTYRCFVAAGPGAEVAWMVERARGPLSPGRSDRPWCTQIGLSVASLSELVPREQRPASIPANVGCRDSPDIWESEQGMMRARWAMADQTFLDDDALECLFKAITRRYPSVCWVSASEDPDTFEGRSELDRRGRGNVTQSLTGSSDASPSPSTGKWERLSTMRRK